MRLLFCTDNTARIQRDVTASLDSNMKSEVLIMVKMSASTFRVVTSWTYR
jgi:hypothetical protein